jgi:hypothetical protein
MRILLCTVAVVCSFFACKPRNFGANSSTATVADTPVFRLSEGIIENKVGSKWVSWGTAWPLDPQTALFHWGDVEGNQRIVKNNGFTPEQMQNMMRDEVGFGGGGGFYVSFSGLDTMQFGRGLVMLETKKPLLMADLNTVQVEKITLAIKNGLRKIGIQGLVYSASAGQRWLNIIDEEMTRGVQTGTSQVVLKAERKGNLSVLIQFDSRYAIDPNDPSLSNWQDLSDAFAGKLQGDSLDSACDAYWNVCTANTMSDPQNYVPPPYVTRLAEAIRPQIKSCIEKKLLENPDTNKSTKVHACLGI